MPRSCAATSNEQRVRVLVFSKISAACLPSHSRWGIPARFFASSLQTLFQTEGAWVLLGANAIALALLACFWLGLTALKTRRTLD